jgi:hypothetical protein
MDRHARHHGWFAEGMESTPHDEGRVGRYCDGLTTTARPAGRVGRFSDGGALVGSAQDEGRFSTGMERAAPLPEPRRVRPPETAPPRKRAA